MKPISFYLTHPKDTLIYILNKINWIFPDKMFLRLMFMLKMGYSLNLDNPKTFCEKLQWLKLYSRKDEYTTMVDKLAAKEYVAQKIGKEYIVPLLGVWDRPTDIDFDTLPDKFVLKTTHGGGGVGVIICSNKSKLNIKQVINNLDKMMKQDIYGYTREWPYKNVKPRVIAEHFLVDESQIELKDYKVLCFDGEPKYIEVDTGRFTDHFRNIYSPDWEFQNMSIGYKNNPNYRHERPSQLEDMIRLSRILSEGFPFLRVDFYCVGNKLYFGELTFFQRSGYTTFSPTTLDEELGDMIHLPKHELK